MYRILVDALLRSDSISSAPLYMLVLVGGQGLKLQQYCWCASLPPYVYIWYLRATRHSDKSTAIPVRMVDGMVRAREATITRCGNRTKRSPVFPFSRNAASHFSLLLEAIHIPWYTGTAVIQIHILL